MSYKLLMSAGVYDLGKTKGRDAFYELVWQVYVHKRITVFAHPRCCRDWLYTAHNDDTQELKS